MADLVQVSANVRSVSGRILTGTAGVAISAGNMIYQSTADSEFYLAGNGTAVKAAVAGIAIANADLNGIVSYQVDGVVDPGATATEGETYVASDTDGNIAPVGDLATGDFVTWYGVGNSDGNIEFNLQASGIAKP